MSYIEVQALGKNYGEHPVLTDVSFQLEQGRIVGLLGPNGAGKTTIVRLLNGVILPDKGSMRVAGFDPANQGDSIRQISGVVTEGAGLYHDMSGEGNLAFFAKLYDCYDKARIAELLERFDLSEHVGKPVGKYSTGMKKRLALAKALLHRPTLLFLDEPTNGLDPEGIQQVMAYLKQLNRDEGTTIFLCSHVLHQLENVCEEYFFLERGEIIEQGTIPQLERKYMKQVKLRVETGLQLDTPAFAGYPAEAVAPNQLIFTLPSKDDISSLLRNILQVSWVHSVQTLNNSLEALYFEIRGSRT